MARVYADRVMEASTSSGTGDFVLSGSVAGFQAFSGVCGSGDTFDYAIYAVDSSGVPTGAWETGTGTYSAANTLTRTTVQESSNSGALVSFPAGPKLVILSQNAASVAAGGGGGGGGGAWNPPTLTLLNDTFGSTPVTTDEDSTFGFSMQQVANIAPPCGVGMAVSGSWTMTARILSGLQANGSMFANYGLTCYNAAKNKLVCWGVDSRNKFHTLRYNNTGFDGYEVLTDMAVTPEWWRLNYNAGTGNLDFQFSGGGKLWSTLLTRDVKTNDFGGSDPSGAGLFLVTDSLPMPLDIGVTYFDLV